MPAQGARGQPRLLLRPVLVEGGENDLLHGRRVVAQTLNLAGALRRERLSEIDRRFRLVDLMPAEREQIADRDPGDEAEERQPPTRDEGVPVAP